MKFLTAAAVCSAMILLPVASTAGAASCATLADDGERLSCFDARAACADIEDDLSRLRCFDEGIESLAISAETLPADVEPEAFDPHPAQRAEAEPEPTPEPGPESEVPVSEEAPIKVASRPVATEVAEEKPAAQTADELFPVRGASTRGETEPEPVTMSAVIVDARRDQRKLTIITLDNGQVWREIRKSRFDYLPGMTVTISEGVLGSVNLKAPGMSKYVKVKRLQ